MSDAWAQACAATNPSAVVIPAGTYSMNVLELKGPCKAPIEVKVDGILKAPADPAQMPQGKQWITVGYVDHFTLSGSGTLDGQGGASAWKKNDCLTNKNCPRLPYVSTYYSYIHTHFCSFIKDNRSMRVC